MFVVAVSILSLFVLVKDRSTFSARASKTWVVDKSGQGDFYDIQNAIDAAEDGDLIRVMSGTFQEHLLVNKSVMLVGENKSSCIIDGNGTGTVVTVNADSAFISGFTVQGSGEDQEGVILNQSSGDRILGNIIVSNYYGVWLNSAERNVIRDNYVQGNVWGIYLQDSGNNTIEDNNVSDNSRRGLHLGVSDGNTVVENAVINNFEGIYLEFSSGNSLRNNSLTENAYGFGVLGSQLPDFIQNIDTSNRIDGEPIYYWVNQRDRLVPPDASCIAVVNSTGITVKDLNLTRQQGGPLFAYTDNSTIENMYVSNARYGFRLFSCENVNVIGNSFARDAEGIHLDYCVNNTVSRNIITNSGEGIFLDHSDSNLLTENSFVNNTDGMRVYYASYNTIYHNNFVNNEAQVSIGLAKILVSNTWDHNGEGNYWSDHADADNDQNGIVDTPYVLNPVNEDNYPLSGFFTDFTVGPKEANEHVDLICNSTISDFECDLAGGIISFNVTGPEESLGFCRTTFPRGLFNDSYNVLIDGLPPLILKELSTSNSTQTSVYFLYAHPMRKVTIIPEYPWTIPLIFAVTLFILVLTRRVSRLPHKQ